MRHVHMQYAHAHMCMCQGGFVLLGRPFISSAISGAGYLRVLYLDEDLRYPPPSPGGLVAWWPGGLVAWLPGGLAAWWPGGLVAW